MGSNAWSMPTTNWQQTGSFLQQATPPSADAVSGTLVQLPCVNEDWLPLILGALDQLRNPSTWLDSLTDSQRQDILGEVDYLKYLVGAALNVPCCNVAMRLNNCVLQFSTDGGATWSDVSGWAADFGSCVRNNVPPPPSNPRGSPTPQLACNRAAFLAQEVAEQTAAVAYAQFNIGNTAIQFATELLPDLQAAGFILTTAFADVAIAYFDYINNANKAHFQAASTDPVFLGDMTCAIYTAIEADGQVTPTNFPTILANIAAISYTYPEVVSASHDYVAAMGYASFASMQDYGAFQDEDCSLCGSSGWCHEFDFTAGTQGWIHGAPGQGTWVAGQGWTADTSGATTALSIEFNGGAFTCTGMEADVYADHGWSGAAIDRSFRYATISSFVRQTNLTTGLVNPVATQADHGFSIASITELAVAWFSDAGTSLGYVRKVRVYGTGPIPNSWLLNCGP